MFLVKVCLPWSSIEILKYSKGGGGRLPLESTWTGTSQNRAKAGCCQPGLLWCSHLSLSSLLPIHSFPLHRLIITIRRGRCDPLANHRSPPHLRTFRSECHDVKCSWEDPCISLKHSCYLS